MLTSQRYDRYTGHLAGMKKTEDSLRRYNKSKRSTFMLFGPNNASGAAAGDKEGRDEFRIRAQMVLDVETLGKNAKSLGTMIDVDRSEEYKELMALAAYKDAEVCHQFRHSGLIFTRNLTCWILA